MIPVFRYRGTALQRLHPLSQLLMVSSFVALALICDNPLHQVAIIASLALLACAAGVFGEWASWWKLCAVMAAATLVINPVVSREGTTVLWRGPTVPVVGRLDITMEAVLFGAGMALRLSAVIWAFALLSLIMDPDRALGLLKGRGSRSALLSALTLRMVPTAMRDSSEILDANRARGVVRDSGSRLQILKSRVPLLLRLAETSLDRGVSLAEAMEARAYGSGRRTRYHDYRLSPGDVAVGSFVLAVLAASIAGLAAGFLSFAYYPSINWDAGVAGVALMLLPVVFALCVLLASGLSTRWIWLKSRI